MADPVPVAYAWRPPVVLASLALLVGVVAVAHNGAHGWPAAAVVLGLGWVGYLATVWRRSRAFLQVDGAMLRLRHRRGFTEVQGHQVSAVSQFLTRRGPSYRLTVRRPTGGPVRLTVPVALLKGGRSTLFRWILTEAPQADLDRGSRRMLERLRAEGLVPQP